MTYYQDGNKLIFENITYENRGPYECVATNNAGTSNKTIEIEVIYIFFTCSYNIYKISYIMNKYLYNNNYINT